MLWKICVFMHEYIIIKSKYLNYGVVVMVGGGSKEEGM